MPPGLKTRLSLAAGLLLDPRRSRCSVSKAAPGKLPQARRGRGGGLQRAGSDSALIGVLGQSDAFGYVFDRQGQKADQIGAFFVVRGDQV